MAPFDTASPVSDDAATVLPALHLDGLSAHTRGLLSIEIPLSVTLATARKPVGQIVRLAPGAILPLKKSCEEELDLHVGNQWLARGEVVQVGEKFGLRITSIVRPEQRRAAASRRGQGRAA
jgi:flagellar motor switch protein FliN/FliY